MDIHVEPPVDPGLGAKVAYLRGQPGTVAIQTHLSWVFLTDAHAYKLKKPVRYRHADFSTLEQRRLACLEEVRLNRRLAPDVYLGAIPLVGDGGLALGGAGTVVDWLVAMRRLPASRMLDRRLAGGRMTRDEVTRVGVALARFYLEQRSEPLPPGSYRRQLERAVTDDRDALLDPAYGLPAERVERVAQAQLQVIQDIPELLETRVRAGHVCEGHGDLRPEHICLESTPVVIDCIDFERELRVVDAVSDLSFLALECERLGAPAVGARLLAIYSALTGDRPPPTLVRLYRGRHALTRAKIAAWHLDDPGVENPAQWSARAREYLELAGV
jgi:aminoglycoside phosphotransferase family enzyme